MMARHYEVGDSEDYTCEAEYSAICSNKRFNQINILDVTVSSEKDMPWILSLFDRTDDHCYDKISIDSFKVINESSADVTDEHLSAIFERIIAGGSKNLVGK